MATDPKQRLTIQEYLALERQSEAKIDYLDGEMFAMSGASREHNLVCGDIFGSLLVAQDRPRLEHWVRGGDSRWILEDIQDLDATVELPSIGCTLPLKRVYERALGSLIPST